MRINVNDIMAGEVGTTRSFSIRERPKLDDLDLGGEFAGDFRLIKLPDQLQLVGQARTKLKANCHRCLRQFLHNIQFELEAQYSSWPAEGEWPIEALKSGDSVIDIDSLVRQEIIVNSPIKMLCAADCLGLCPACGKLQEQPHQHRSQGTRVKDRVRVKS